MHRLLRWHVYQWSCRASHEHLPSLSTLKCRNILSLSLSTLFSSGRVWTCSWVVARARFRLVCARTSATARQSLCRHVGWLLLVFRKYKTIQFSEERNQYKKDFSVEYKEYLSLHAKVSRLPVAAVQITLPGVSTLRRITRLLVICAGMLCFFV